MGRTLSAVLIVLTACATAPEARITREIQSQYDKLAAAFNRQDIEAVLSFRLPTFETFGPQGQHNNAAEMAEYTRNWLLVQNKPPIDVKFTIQSVELRSEKEAAVKVLQRASRYQDGGRRKAEGGSDVRCAPFRFPPSAFRLVGVYDVLHEATWFIRFCADFSELYRRPASKDPSAATGRPSVP